MADIITLAGAFKDELSLQAYCDAQFQLIEQLRDSNAKLEAEVAHLKTLITDTVPVLSKDVVKIEVPLEQAICEMQIAKLQRTAMDRDLTLEETKRLDLLIKNLYLAKGQSTAIIADYSKLPPNVSEAALIEIARDSGNEDT